MQAAIVREVYRTQNVRRCGHDKALKNTLSNDGNNSFLVAKIKKNSVITKILLSGLSLLKGAVVLGL